MDVGFEFLLPIQTEIKELEIVESFYEWGGVSYSQGAKTQLHGFGIYEYPVNNSLLGYLPKESLLREEKTKRLYVSGLYDWRNQFQDSKGAFARLWKLLEAILSNDINWAVFWIDNHDDIDDSFEGNIGTVFDEIIKSVLVNRRGFVVWHNAQSKI